MRRIATIPIVAYRRLLSPLLAPTCIYTPSCSAYAQAAILKHGVLPGTLLGMARLLRCVGGLFVGGEDLVPETFSFEAVAHGYRRFSRRRGRGANRGDRPEDGGDSRG